LKMLEQLAGAADWRGVAAQERAARAVAAAVRTSMPGNASFVYTPGARAQEGCTRGLSVLGRADNDRWWRYGCVSCTRREHLPAPAPKEPMQGVRGREHLPAPAHQEHMQGVRGGGHLPAPAHQEQMQGVRGREHLQAQEPREPMQGVRGREHLPAPAHQEQMQGVPRGDGHVDAGWPGGAGEASTCCW